MVGLSTTNMDPLFASVFPAASLDHTTPTPIATPDLGFSAPGQSFGGLTSPIAQKHHQSLTPAQLQVKRNISWSTATRFLSLAYLSNADFDSNEPPVAPRRIKTRDVEEAIEFLLSGEGLQGPSDSNWDLVEWYLLEVRTHFLGHIAPGLNKIWASEIPCDLAASILLETAQRLEYLQSIYQAPVVEHILPAVMPSKRRHTLEPGASAERRRSRISYKFERKLQALFVQALPAKRLSQTISHITYAHAVDTFHIHGDGKSSGRQDLELQSAKDYMFMDLLKCLQDVGLGGENAQRAFAHAMDKVIHDFVASHYMKVDWEKGRPVTKQLKRWVNHGFTPFVRTVLGQLGVNKETDLTDAANRWLDLALTRLGKLRISQLFDYIQVWDRSRGAISDIREYITSPSARLYLTTTFSTQVQRRLLQAGATTTQILNLYISIIGASIALDSKGVLLDRVASPIRIYLRRRDDTARIIVASLLADVDSVSNDEHTEIPGGGEISLEIAKFLNNPIANYDELSRDLDWDNMEWTPDPVDAAPDSRGKVNPEDAISALLSLYDREDFINELKTILGDHLLRGGDDDRFEKEERLLELFKNRLGSDKLQACEVMLHDVQQSRRINGIIHKYPGYAAAQGRSGGTTELNAQILSSFFWPSLKDDVFAVPPPIQALQQNYEKGFEGIKDMRKLEWLHALGRVTVELELEDRKVEEIVPTWTASVIYAFQGDGVVKKSVEDLVEELSMDEALVRNALVFWQGKHVLRASDPEPHLTPSRTKITYTVIERLSTESASDSTAANAAQTLMEATNASTNTMSNVKSHDDIMDENKDLYRQFVLGMLTNQGNMNVARVWMMLKVAVPGGFPGGAEEVRGLLEGLCEEGLLVGQGDIFGVKRE